MYSFTYLFVLHLAAVAALVVQTLPGRSQSDTIAAIKRELMLAPRESNVIFSQSSRLDSSLEQLPLFKIEENGPNGTSASIEITCQKCYIKGDAAATITAKEDFNVTAAAVSIKASVNSTLHQIADYVSMVVHDMKDYIANETHVLIEDIAHLESLDDLHGFHLVPPGIDFDVDIGKFDDVSLEVAFTEAEIYVELSILFSAGVTYSLNLYTSSELGYEIGKVFVGFVATIDLILSVDSQIELDSGFHIKFDKKMAMKLALFADEASHIELFVTVPDFFTTGEKTLALTLSSNGGQFEFLPVTVATAGSVLHAVLRIGIKSGFSLSAGFGPDVQVFNQTGHLQLGAGIEASAYANAAEFITNITFTGNNTGTSAEKRGIDACELQLQQGYQMAIGAAAGASVELLDNVWGPTPKTEIPIYYTTLSAGCATTKTAAVETQQPTQLAARGDAVEGSTTTTTTTEVTQVAMQCLSAGMTNCPASLKTRVTNVASTTLTATARSGEDVVWPATAGQNTVVSPVAFGANALAMTASSGKPSSYIPPPPTFTSTSGNGNGSANGGESIKGSSGNSNKIIIGVCVGLGVPLLAAIIAATIFCRSRKKTRYNSVSPVAVEATEVEYKDTTTVKTQSVSPHL